jgi:hypothetical protein
VKPAARLYVLLARKSSEGVVCRRGPSKQVLLIKWNLNDDTFEFGQWLKGRVYERRCDLSPEGNMLLYFAANWRKPYQSWSAISRPPFFTALALWPKGDGWGGGGRFLSRDRVELNHRQVEMTLADDFVLPSWLSLKPFGDRPGWGEDDPIWSSRLLRDGWKLTAYPEKTKDDFGAKVWIEYDPPVTWEKAHPRWPKKYLLRMRILGIKERDGTWYIIEHSIIGEKGYTGAIGRSEWANWSQDGDLLFAQSGCLYRLRPSKGKFGPVEASKQIADFNGLPFQRVEPPEDAQSWPSLRPKLRRKRNHR